VVIPPYTKTLFSSTVDLLEQWLDSGGAVIAVEPLPTMIDAQGSGRLQALFQRAGVTVLPGQHGLEAALEAVLPRQVSLLEAADRARLGPLIEWMAADNRDDLLRELDPGFVEEILPLVAKAERHDIRMLLSCPEDSAGALMTTEYASLPADITAGEAIARLRMQAPDSESIYYIYVLDAERKLLGFVSLRDLILARPTALVAELMQRDVIAVRMDEPQEKVVDLLARFDFIAIPVVDDHSRLVGIVTHDDVLDAVRQEATDEAQMIAAIAPLGESYLEAAITSMTW